MGGGGGVLTSIKRASGGDALVFFFCWFMFVFSKKIKSYNIIVEDQWKDRVWSEGGGGRTRRE